MKVFSIIKRLLQKESSFLLPITHDNRIKPDAFRIPYDREPEYFFSFLLEHNSEYSICIAKRIYNYDWLSYLYTKDNISLSEELTDGDLNELYDYAINRFCNVESDAFSIKEAVLIDIVYLFHHGSLSNVKLFSGKLPFLESICWQTKDPYSFTTEEMLSRYERGWHYKDMYNNLGYQEKIFIREIAKYYKSWLQTEI